MSHDTPGITRQPGRSVAWEYVENLLGFKLNAEYEISSVYSRGYAKDSMEKYLDECLKEFKIPTVLTQLTMLYLDDDDMTNMFVLWQTIISSLRDDSHLDYRSPFIRKYRHNLYKLCTMLAFVIHSDGLVWTRESVDTLLDACQYDVDANFVRTKSLFYRAYRLMCNKTISGKFI